MPKEVCKADPVVEVNLSFLTIIFCILLGGIILSMIALLFEKNGFNFLKKEIRWP